MNEIVTVQAVAFAICIIIVLDLVLQAFVKRIFPKWSRGLCSLVIGIVLFAVLFSTVPGRTRHLEYLQRWVADEAAERSFKDGSVKSYLGNLVAGWASNFVLQGLRVETYLGLVSVGYLEKDGDRIPVSVGVAGFVCRNFFIYIPIRERPDVEVALGTASDDSRQLVINNHGGENYSCAVFHDTGGELETLCMFDLPANGLVRVRPAKKGWGNKLKALLESDPSVVTLSVPLDAAHVNGIAFRRGGRKLKSALLQWTENGASTSWNTPD